MRHQTTVPTVVGLAVLVLLLAGCGGGGGGGSKEPFVPIVGTGGGNVVPPGDGDPPGPAPTERLNYRILDQGPYSAIRTELHAVAHTDQEYIQIWTQHRPPPPPGVGAPVMGPPYVDFSQEFVVAIFLGNRPTGGYSVEPVLVTHQASALEVTYEERQPGPNCVVTTAITGPYLLLAVSPIRDGTFTFTRNVVVVDCP